MGTAYASSAENFSGKYTKFPTGLVVGITSVVVAALIYFFGIRPALKKRGGKNEQSKGVEQRGTGESVDIMTGVKYDSDNSGQINWICWVLSIQTYGGSSILIYCTASSDMVINQHPSVSCGCCFCKIKESSQKK